MNLYQKYQNPVWLLFLFGAILCVPAYIGFAQGWHFALVFPIVFILILEILFGRLQVTLTAENLKLKFGIRLIQKTIPVENIVAATAVRNSWWYGFGIRLTPHGWMWNISGLNAVELTYKNGKKFRIGTEEPEILVCIISVAQGQPQAYLG